MKTIISIIAITLLSFTTAFFFVDLAMPAWSIRCDGDDCVYFTRFSNSGNIKGYDLARATMERYRKKNDRIIIHP